MRGANPRVKTIAAIAAATGIATFHHKVLDPKAKIRPGYLYPLIIDNYDQCEQQPQFLNKRQVDFKRMFGSKLVQIEKPGIGLALYDISKFKHPGGPIINVAEKRNITTLFNDGSLAFHTGNPRVKKALEEILDGYTDTKFPELSESELQEAMQKIQAEQEAIEKDKDNNEFIWHNELNGEPKLIAFDENGSTQEKFIRQHAEFPQRKNEKLIEIITNNCKQAVELNFDKTPKKYPTEMISLWIICAGNMRSEFKKNFDQPVNGISWGNSACHVSPRRAVKLKHILQENPKHITLPSTENYLIKVTGSDGYASIIHSSELENSYLVEEDDSIRSFIPGAPGFRQIQHVETIETFSERSEENLNIELMKKFNFTFPHLNNRDRQIIAESSEAADYVLRDKNNNAYDFTSYFKPSAVVTESKKNADDKIEISGYAYSSNKITRVELNDEQKSTATLKTPQHGSGDFSLFKVNVKTTEEKTRKEKTRGEKTTGEKTTGEKTMNEQARVTATDEHGNQTKEQISHNKRGVGFPEQSPYVKIS